MLDYILNATPFALLAAGAVAVVWGLCKAGSGDWDAYEPGVWDDNRRDGEDGE